MIVHYILFFLTVRSSAYLYLSIVNNNSTSFLPCCALPRINYDQPITMLSVPVISVFVGQV